MQLRRVLDAAAEKRLLVQMGYMYRYNPGIVFLRQFVREGCLGDIFLRKRGAGGDASCEVGLGRVEK